MKLKPLFWIGTSRRDLKELPDLVQDGIGFALFSAQNGEKHTDAKPLSGFGGAGVLEIVEDYDGDTYRAIYTVRFTGAVYALHIFQKKSKHGVATPRAEIDIVKARLRLAEEHHAEWLKRKESNG
jgi:phage-related protein